MRDLQITHAATIVRRCVQDAGGLATVRLGRARSKCRRIWPRTASELYEEPKKFVAHGYASGTDDSVGRRPRTRCTITANGRRALAAWLSQPGEGPILECEQLVKIHFADSGTKADVIANLDATRAWVLEQNKEISPPPAPTMKVEAPSPSEPPSTSSQAGSSPSST